MKNISIYISLVCALILPHMTIAQSYRSLVNDGNDMYKEKKYDDAEIQYKKSAEKKADRLEGHFNLGNTLYRKGDYKGAMEAYKKAITKVTDQKQASQSLYNIGNSFLDAADKVAKNPAMAQAGDQAGNAAMEGYKQAVEAYKHSLKLNPKDEEARYNLAYAQRKMLELQQQQQNKKDNKQNKDQQKKDNQKQQDQKKNDQQKKDNQQQQEQNQQQQKSEQDKMKEKQEPQRENKMSKEQAERILEALKNDEKDLQKKLKAKIRTRVQVDKDW